MIVWWIEGGEKKNEPSQKVRDITDPELLIRINIIRLLLQYAILRVTVFM
jgi:hypothetical protein